MPKYSGARARAAAREVPVSPLAKPMVTARPMNGSMLALYADSREKARHEKALGRLDRFMADVLLPLCERTNAVVFTDAITPSCALSSAFMRKIFFLGWIKRSW